MVQPRASTLIRTAPYSNEMKFTIPKKLRKISKLTEKNLVERLAKLTEESGELAAEILKYKGLKQTDKTVKEVRADLEEEAVDTLIMGLDIVAYLEMSDTKVRRLLSKKMKKWLDGLK